VSSNIAESYPGVSSKLTRSFAGEVYTKIFTRLIGRVLGKSANRYEDLFTNMVSDFGGRMYYEISSWYDILRLLPFSSKIIPTLILILLYTILIFIIFNFIILLFCLENK